MNTLLKTAATCLCAAATLLSAAETEADRRLKSAAAVLNEVMGIPEKSIPQDLLGKAECFVIVPGLKKGAFIIGGKYGRGFMTCRKKGGVGWSSPGAVRVEGGSFGFQIGGSETDVIMLVMNERGAQRLLESKFTLGGDASVAAGPVGREASAQTDAKMTAEILTWSRSRGVFAGIALQGATLRTDQGSNKEMYGREMTNKEVFDSGPQATAAGAELIGSINKYSSRK
jgi:lipid-binding SYLF domain-containing protein